MTSPLVEPVVDDPELDPEADTGAGEEDSSAESATPWTRLGRRDGSQSGQPSVTAPGGNGSGSSADPGSQSAVPGQPQAGAGPGQGGSGGRGAVAPPAGGAAAPGAAVPGAPAQAPPAPAAPAPAGAVAPNTSKTTDDAAADPTGGLLNPDTLTALAPTAMMAGAMMLP
ncbi:hypothetical protein AB0M12_44025, partial [Nocardia vinacea]